MKNTFITGIDGFVGSHLAANLLEKGYNVVGLYRDEKPMNPLKKMGYESQVTRIRGDACDEQLMKRILTQYGINHVFHLAAQAIVSIALKDPVTTFHVNCNGTGSVLDACKGLDMDSILVSSTDKVYGEGLDRKESDILDAKGIYETSKICEDYISRSFFHAYHLPIIVTRACNIYGEMDDNSRIIPNTIRDLKAGRSPIIFREGRLPSIREYIYVDDVCDAMIMLSESIRKVAGSVFNIGSGCSATQEEVVRKTISISGRDIKPIYKDRVANLLEIQRQTVDSGNINTAMGWKPRYNLDGGLKRTWDRWI